MWKEFNHGLKPEDWGWYADNGRFMPLKINQPAAPSEILNVTCFKYGMHCTPVCGECCGVSCTNSQLPDLSNDDMNDDNILNSLHKSFV